MIVLWSITITIVLLYIILILLLVIGWYNNRSFVATRNPKNTKISVIVPVRNEEANVAVLLDSLLKQEYSHKMYEIIIVDDHSTDRTFYMIDEFRDSKVKITLLSLRDKQTGKKKAIEVGIQQANGDIVVTTDADCKMGNQWLKTIALFYERFKPKMIIGPVAFEQESNFFQRLQSVEFMSLIASGAGAAGISRSILCNGANLAFERKSFLHMKDAMKQKLASGDDILFMLKLKKEHSGKIMFLKSKEAIVYTKPQADLTRFTNQRKRWVSKSRSYKDFDIVFTAITVFAMNFLLLALGVLIPVAHEVYLLFTATIIIKAAVDFALVAPYSFFTGKQKLIGFLFLLQPINAFYTVVIAIAGNFGSFSWKGRNFKQGVVGD